MLKNQNIISKKKWSSKSEEIKDASHIRGFGRWKNIKFWNEIGEYTFQLLKETEYLALKITKKKIFRIFNKPTGLEYGVGGGSNVKKLSKFCKKIYGTDISLENLKITTKIVNEEANKNFVPILINDGENLFKLNEKVDFFYSSAVFQHLPSKDYCINVLKHIKKVLKKHSIGFIQVRLESSYKNKDFYTKNFSSDNYNKHYITFVSFDIFEFYEILESFNFKILNVKVNPLNNYGYFFLLNN